MAGSIYPEWHQVMQSVEQETSAISLSHQKHSLPARPVQNDMMLLKKLDPGPIFLE